MRNQTSHLQRYLEHYGEPDGLRAAERVTGKYQRALVVPCFDEPENLLNTLLPQDACQLLVVLVVNMPDNADNSAAKRTLALLDQLANRARSAKADTTLDARRNIGLLIIDRASRPLPKNHGVGLARKIGSDCAAALWQSGHVAQDWIYNTDADVELPNGYFGAAMPDRGVAMFPFRHQAPTAELQHKADLYELHLHYYKNRLKSAGSPYAYHTLGSTLAVHSQDYAMVRGYPRRNAGEDFYLLNKLAKVAPIHSLQGPTLRIQARYSNRAPFGTGAALKKMQDPNAYLSYSPRSFSLLDQTLADLEHACQGHALQTKAEALEILDELGFTRFFAHAQAQYAKPANLRKALYDWFDAFRTLRFIHECRRFYPDVPLLESLGELFPNLSGYSTSALARHFLTLDTQTYEVTTAMGSASHKRDIYSQL